MKEEQIIRKFEGEYRFLSNFYPAPVLMDHQWYPSVEHAYQAAKFHPESRVFFTTGTAGRAKRMGKQPGKLPHFDSIKLDVMKQLCTLKFSLPRLRQMLIATGRADIQEGNMWGDTFWGVNLTTGYGHNHLGRILMDIRDVLIQEYTL